MNRIMKSFVPIMIIIIAPITTIVVSCIYLTKIHKLECWPNECMVEGDICEDNGVRWDCYSALKTYYGVYRTEQRNTTAEYIVYHKVREVAVANCQKFLYRNVSENCYFDEWEVELTNGYAQLVSTIILLTCGISMLLSAITVIISVYLARLRAKSSKESIEVTNDKVLSTRRIVRIKRYGHKPEDRKIFWFVKSQRKDECDKIPLIEIIAE